MSQDSTPRFDANKLDKIQEAPIIIAVAGHANQGKTSVVRTLCRMPSFGEVSDFPGTTKKVSGVKFKVEAKTYMIVFDTPGFQNSALAIQNCGANFTIDDIQSFFQSSQAFSDDLEALKQVLASDLVLYVIDSTVAPTHNLKSDFRILARSKIPVIPIFNFVKGGTSAAQKAWDNFLKSNNYHLYCAYDAHFYRAKQEDELYDKMKAVLKAHSLQREFFDYHIAIRKVEEARKTHKAVTLLAEMLLDCTAYCHRTSGVGSQEKNKKENEAFDSFQKKIGERESTAMKEMVAAYEFNPNILERKTGQLESDELWVPDLFGKEIAKHLGIGASAGVVGGGAIGACIGLLFPVIGPLIGGTVGSAIGAMIVSVAAAFYNKSYDEKAGRLEIRCSEELLNALIQRSLLLMFDLKYKGMADTSDIVVKNAIAQAMQGERTEYANRMMVAKEYVELRKKLSDHAKNAELSKIDVDPEISSSNVKAQRKKAIESIRELVEKLVAMM